MQLTQHERVTTMKALGKGVMILALLGQKPEVRTDFSAKHQRL